jgi:DNA-binding PadR family transcriptional regulator
MTIVAQDPAASLLAPVELYLLMVLAEGASYGYEILKQVEAHSGGAVRPDIGSLYRVLARLTSHGYVIEADAPRSASDAHPGRARRYYRITAAGRKALRAELVRLRSVVDLAAQRDLLPGRGRP